MWKFNANETLSVASILKNKTEYMTGINGLGFDLGRRDDVTLIYGSELSFVVKPFNASIHEGKYTLKVNTTNKVADFSYEVNFELAQKTVDDEFEGKLSIYP